MKLIDPFHRYGGIEKGTGKKVWRVKRGAGDTAWAYLDDDLNGKVVVVGWATYDVDERPPPPNIWLAFFPLISIGFGLGVIFGGSCVGGCIGMLLGTIVTIVGWIVVQPDP